MSEFKDARSELAQLLANMTDEEAQEWLSYIVAKQQSGLEAQSGDSKEEQ